MSKVFINGTGCISAQKTFDGSFLEGVAIDTENNVLPLVNPPYKEFIPATMIRRMGPGVKNGVVASALALKEAGEPTLDAIITGTGVGCIKDSESFLSAILNNAEKHLTPTSFIQSTHNTVGAQIALGLGCKSYNFTYVNGAVSFESSLIDAELQILAGEAENILVGGVDEKAEITYHLFELAGLIKNIEDKNSPGAVYSEGASFFVLSASQQESSYAVLGDVTTINHLENEEVNGFLMDFLTRNSLEISDIDAIVLGKNGDKDYDHYYDLFLESIDETIPQVHYKHLSGEYNTASAFGFWVGSNILKNQQIPDCIQLNKHTKSSYKNVILYNQYRGVDHSLVWLSRC